LPSFLDGQDFASLEVHVYDTEIGNLYVHHDIPLPSYPLCVAQGRVAGEGLTGNYCAVGTFDPAVEIWNLDVINALEPTCILGGSNTSYADDLLRQQMLSEATAIAEGIGDDNTAEIQALLEKLRHQQDNAKSKALPCSRPKAYEWEAILMPYYRFPGTRCITR
jgi:hypothetical protein